MGLSEDRSQYARLCTCARQVRSRSNLMTIEHMRDELRCSVRQRSRPATSDESATMPLWARRFVRESTHDDSSAHEHELIDLDTILCASRPPDGPSA